MKGKVSYIIVEEDICKGMEDAFIPYVIPMSALGRGVESPGNIGGVTIFHKIVEYARVYILNNVTGGVNYNPSLVIAEDKTDRRQE